MTVEKKVPYTAGMPTVFIEAPAHISYEEVQANAPALCRAVMNAIKNDGRRVAQSYTVTLTVVGGGRIQIAVLGSGEIIGYLDEDYELAVAGWFDTRVQ